jgi:hypothetical protein
MIEILPIHEKPSVHNYPYGSLQCTATFGVEFNKNKGFRSEFQTINPKTDRLNAMKNGTYDDFKCLVKEENGHYKWYTSSCNGLEAIISTLKFIGENFDILQLTTEMHEHIVLQSMRSIIVGNAYTKLSNEDMPNYLDMFFKDNMVKLRNMSKQPISAQTYKDIIFDTDGMKQYISEHPIIKSVIVE